MKQCCKESRVIYGDWDSSALLCKRKGLSEISVEEGKMQEEQKILEQRMDELTKNVRNVCENEKGIFEVLNQQNEMMSVLQAQIYRLEYKLQNFKYEKNDPRMQEDELFYPIIKSKEELIDKLVLEGKSLARFGDGEFSVMEHIVRQKFQHLDDKLAKRLQEVITTEDDRILIGIADNYGNLDKYTEQAATAIRIYMTEETRKIHQKYLKKDRIYYDAYVSRPYILYRDKEHAEDRFNNLRRIWEKRSVIVIEGAKTRLGVGNGLLDNAASVRRILGPAVSSFDRYEDILKGALVAAEKDVLFLVAMGPCAGVVVYDLAKAGYQAIDIGHVDLEYEWYRAGVENRGPVKNRYNNEFPGGENVEETDLPKEYFEQIIEDFS